MIQSGLIQSFSCYNNYLPARASSSFVRQLITEKMDDITDELYYEIMVGPEAYELVPHVKVVLETLAVSDGMATS